MATSTAPQPALVERAAALLGVVPELVAPALERLAAQDRIRREVIPFTPEAPGAEPGAALGETPATYGQPAVYLTPLYLGERGVAEKLRELASAIPGRLSDLPPAFITLDDTLSPEQQAAIRTALSHPLSVLTGGPGTGKTTALKALIALVEAAKKVCALASPTGRAAKRLAEATGRPASTIHRLLGFKPGQGFAYTAENPLPVDLLVVDEASMLDLLLAYHLLKALQPGTHLLLVGDVDQLPRWARATCCAI